MRQIAIVLLVVAVIGGAFYSVRSTSNPLIHRVAEGVTLEGKNISGFTAEELGTYLDTVMNKVEIKPIAPQVDSRTKGVIPGLAGRKIDREATIAKALESEANLALSYIWNVVLPEPTPLEYPIYQGNPAKKQITFVVNVAWGNDALIQMLEIFKRHEITTTFFIVGRWADKFPELVREIYKHGHEFGNHAYSDPHLPQLSEAKIAEEITKTTAAIKKAVGDVDVKFFSPPYNDFDSKVIKVAASLKYQTVLCSLDTADWMRPGVERIVRRVVPNAHNGAIVLMHPTEQTPAALEIMIIKLLEQGYELVPLSELLAP